MLKYPLNRVIIIEKKETVKNSIGSLVPLWSEYITTYSAVYSPSSDIRYAEEGQLMTMRTVFTIRYNSDTKIINNKYRIKYNDDYYKIIQVSELTDSNGIPDRTGIKITGIAFDDD